MSLEAKFAELKIDDVSSIVDAVKGGVKKSGLADSIEVLKARCASKDADEALAAMKTVKALVEECPQAHAFTKECLGACKFSSVLVASVIVMWFAKIHGAHLDLCSNAIALASKHLPTFLCLSRCSLATTGMASTNLLRFLRISAFRSFSNYLYFHLPLQAFNKRFIRVPMSARPLRILALPFARRSTLSQ